MGSFQRTHVSQEASSHRQGLPLAGLELTQEVALVEIIEALEVAEDERSFAPQVLGHVRPVQQGEVVSQDVGQGAHVLSLCQQQLLHDALQLPVQVQG